MEVSWGKIEREKIHQGGTRLNALDCLALGKSLFLSPEGAIVTRPAQANGMSAEVKCATSRKLFRPLLVHFIRAEVYSE